MKASGTVEANVNTVRVDWVVTVESTEVIDTEVALQFVGSLSTTSTLASCSLTPNLASDANVQCEYRGSSEFHFLLPGSRYDFSLSIVGISENILQLKASTPQVAGSRLMNMLASRMPPDAWRFYISENHSLGGWLSESPEDTVWATQPASYELLKSLWINACFTLPTPESPLMTCPNPTLRYCLDLKKAGSWLHSKKVRRHKADFYLTVNAQFADTFNIVERTHTQNNRGTWITPELVSALNRCRLEDCELKVYAFELWEKTTRKLVAAIMSYSVGDIFHDYSTATMLMDKRSTGAILTKVVGHLLTECGFTLWYWGFKNPYMAEYDAKYGGVQLNSQKEFWPRWKEALESARRDEQKHLGLAQSVIELVSTKSDGTGELDLACLN